MHDYITDLRKTAVSDPLRQTAAEDPMCVVDDTTGLVYMVYLSSPADRRKYGETHQEISLAVFSISAPEHTEQYSIELRPSEFSDNKNIAHKGAYGLCGANIVDAGDRVRVFYYIGIHKCDYFYRDFDKVAKHVGPAVRCMFKTSSDAEPKELNVANFAAAFDDGNPDFVARELSFSTKISRHGDELYTTFSIEKGYPMIAKSTDLGATWEKVGEIQASFDGILPEYENPLAILDGIFYCFMRCGNNDKGDPHKKRELLWYSVDGGKNWCGSGLLFDTGMTKPDMFVYDGALYVAYSQYIADRTTYARAWRCNVRIDRICKVNGAFSAKQVANYFNEFGMVEFNILPYHKKLVMHFSSGDLFQHITSAYFYGKSQGKDLIYQTEITP